MLLTISLTGFKALSIISSASENMFNSPATMDIEFNLSIPAASISMFFMLKLFSA